jgi:hypothetical protein
VLELARKLCVERKIVYRCVGSCWSPLFSRKDLLWHRYKMGLACRSRHEPTNTAPIINPGPHAETAMRNFRLSVPDAPRANFFEFLERMACGIEDERTAALSNMVFWSFVGPGAVHLSLTRCT